MFQYETNYITKRMINQEVILNNHIMFQIETFLYVLEIVHRALFE